MGWDRIDLPLYAYGLLSGLRPPPGEIPPTVEDLTAATEELIMALMDYPEGVQDLDQGLRDLLAESNVRLPVESLSDSLIERIIEGVCVDPDSPADASRDLIGGCLKPYLTPDFVESVHWSLIFRARRMGAGRRILAVVVWGLWNLHQDLPISENAVWDAFFRITLSEFWEPRFDAEEMGDIALTDPSQSSSQRDDILRLRACSQDAVERMVAGEISLDLPLFSVVNGALRMRSLIADPDHPGYDALFDIRKWGAWWEQPITTHMRTPMKRDWPHFLPTIKHALNAWIEERQHVHTQQVESLEAMVALLECHGLPELDGVLGVIYASCVRDKLSNAQEQPGVSAIIEEDHVSLLLYAQDLQEAGWVEAARHVRRSLFQRT